MDIRMPELDGLEATRRILTAAADAPRVIMLTTFDPDDLVYAALSAGASGFLLEEVTPEHLLAAVRMVRTGDALLAPVITRRLVEHYARTAPESDTTESAPTVHRNLTALTYANSKSCAGSSRALSNAELAGRLYLSKPPSRPTSAVSSPSSACAIASRPWSPRTRPDWSTRTRNRSPDRRNRVRTHARRCGQPLCAYHQPRFAYCRHSPVKTAASSASRTDATRSAAGSPATPSGSR